MKIKLIDKHVSSITPTTEPVPTTANENEENIDRTNKTMPTIEIITLEN